MVQGKQAGCKLAKQAEDASRFPRKSNRAAVELREPYVYIQRSARVGAPGLVNFTAAVAYLPHPTG